MPPVLSTLLACFCRAFQAISAVVVSFNFFSYSSAFCTTRYAPLANFNQVVQNSVGICGACQLIKHWLSYVFYFAWSFCNQAACGGVVVRDDGNPWRTFSITQARTYGIRPVFFHTERPLDSLKAWHQKLLKAWKNSTLKKYLSPFFMASFIA